MFYYVYVLKCSDNELYIGCTENLQERMQRHTNGYVPATKHRRPLHILAYFAMPDKYIAFNFETYLKTGLGRSFLNKHMLTKKAV